MKLHILGGGDEVGASMLLVESDAGSIVVDCGIRMGAGSASQTPDLSGVESTDVEAIFVTHAHLDHTGALPLLHAALPRVPVYCTAPTKALMRVLLLDAVKIMDEKLGREGELPLYPVEAVESLLAHVETVPFGGTVFAGQSDGLKVRLLPAGHILGAAMVETRGPGMSCLVTGDISQADQHSVAGLAMPKEGSRIVVAESTYGGRMHSDRKTEENRFVAKARQVLDRGGKLVVPAFALGRAQELLLILVRAMRRGDIDPVPVYADGMVRSVCQVYSRFGNYLPPFARKLNARHGNPFFGILENVQEVRDGRQRDEIVSGPPCIIVASSGMLTGGASVFYVERLAGKEENCIAITGYQDEEAPGRRLLGLAEGETNCLVVNNASVLVNCEVSKYALSAHIDGYSLLQFVSGLGPDHVVWVHGDEPARNWLNKQCSSGASHLVRNGDLLELMSQSGPAKRVKRAIGAGEPLSPEKVPLLAAALRRERSRGGFLNPHLILDRWYGEGRWGNPEERLLFELLADSHHFEQTDRGKQIVFELLSEEEALAAAARGMGPSGPHEVNEHVARLFPPETGLYRAKQYHAENRVSLCFHFPLKAEREWAERLAELARITQWTVEVYPQPNQGILLETARKLVSHAADVVKAGYRADSRSVEVKLSAPLAPETLDRLLCEFLAATGYDLCFTVQGSSPAMPKPEGRSPGAAAGISMEINAAFAAIQLAFSGKPHRLLKKSKRAGPEGEHIELRFVTPAAGARYADDIAELVRTTGWTIILSPNITPQELQRLAVEALPDGCTAAGEPRIFTSETAVRIPCSLRPPPPDCDRISREFEEHTGFALLLE